MQIYILSYTNKVFRWISSCCNMYSWTKMAKNQALKRTNQELERTIAFFSQRKFYTLLVGLWFVFQISSLFQKQQVLVANGGGRSIKNYSKKRLFPSVFKEPSKKLESTHPWPKFSNQKVKNITQKNKANFSISTQHWKYGVIPNHLK